MAALLRIAFAAWWLALALVPVALMRTARGLERQLGCAPGGECYLPGAGLAWNLDLLAIGMAIMVWPAGAWFIWRSIRSFTDQ